MLYNNCFMGCYTAMNPQKSYILLFMLLMKFNLYKQFDQDLNFNFGINPALNLTNLCPTDTHFECVTTKKCIKLDQVCDKIFDCSDRSDEYNCNCKSV